MCKIPLVDCWVLFPCCQIPTQPLIIFFFIELCVICSCCISFPDPSRCNNKTDPWCNNKLGRSTGTYVNLNNSFYCYKHCDVTFTFFIRIVFKPYHLENHKPVNVLHCSSQTCSKGLTTWAKIVKFALRVEPHIQLTRRSSRAKPSLLETAFIKYFLTEICLIYFQWQCVVRETSGRCWMVSVQSVSWIFGRKSTLVKVRESLWFWLIANKVNILLLEPFLKTF